MPRPSRLDEQRRELLPLLAAAFGDLGFHQATTAEIARRCSVGENILYRHWANKVAMFVAAIDYVSDLAIETWRRAVGEAEADRGTGAEHILTYEADHLGEFANYRIIFSALGDADEPDIRNSLRRMYRRFHRALRDQLVVARGGRRREPNEDLATWAIIGLGTVATIGRALGLVPKVARRRLIQGVGRVLMRGVGPA